jgi:hypothetical protein
MRTKRRFHDARLFLGGGTIALLLAIWSALTVHDIQARDTQAAVVPETTNVTSPTITSSQPATSNPTTRQQTTTTRSVPHTRTRAS